MNFPRIHVEDNFNQIVREYGGIIVDEHLKAITGKPPDFPNADYVFHSDKIVAELKCMMEDTSESPSNQAKVNAAIDRFFTAGQIKSKTIDEETWPKLPKELQSEIYNLTNHSITARVKKANRQIRETKAKLGLYAYDGLLLIANDGLESMPPAAFVHATLECVQKHGENISCFVFFTVNVFAVMKDVSTPVLFWFPLHMTKPPKIESGFLLRIGKAWQGLIKRKWGVQFADHEIQNEDMERFWKARNLPKS